jgi:paraquat-inducible protein A
MNFGGFFTDRILWVISCVLFIAGISLPMFSFHRFFIFNDTFSLLSSVFHLLVEGELFLFIVVFLFSIVGPIYKLYLLNTLVSAKAVSGKDRIRLIQKLAIIGKWSMADVFVVAIIASTVKIGLIASVSIHIGLLLFGLAVLSSMLLVQRQMSGYELRPIS